MVKVCSVRGEQNSGVENYQRMLYLPGVGHVDPSPGLQQQVKDFSLSRQTCQVRRGLALVVLRVQVPTIYQVIIET